MKDGSAVPRAAGEGTEVSASDASPDQEKSNGEKPVCGGREVSLTLAYSRPRRGIQGKRKVRSCVIYDMSTTRRLHDGVRN